MNNLKNNFFIFFALIFCGFLSFAQGTFFLDSNGVTVKCTGCVAGNTGQIGGVGPMYTAHDNTSINAKPIGDTDWNRVVTTPVTNMSSLFNGETDFNQDISSWDVSNVLNFNYMFQNATAFNQDISEWNIISVTNMENMFDNSGLSTTNYDALLIDWAEQNVKPNVLFGAANLTYCVGENARQSLIDNKGWLFTGDQLECATAGLDDLKQLDISIYPNPTSDLVYIDGNYTNLNVVVYDILGKQLMKESVTNSIDISQLEKGVYILKLSDGVKLTTKRIIKN